MSKVQDQVNAAKALVKQQKADGLATSKDAVALQDALHAMWRPSTRSNAKRSARPKSRSDCIARLAPEVVIEDLKAVDLDASVSPTRLLEQYIVVGRR
jgi:hypothetical protein